MPMSRVGVHGPGRAKPYADEAGPVRPYERSGGVGPGWMRSSGGGGGPGRIMP